MQNETAESGCAYRFLCEGNKEQENFSSDIVQFSFLPIKAYFTLPKKEKMNYFSVCFPLFHRMRLDIFSHRSKKCTKNYTKIPEFVENFTVPLAFLRKSGILILYSGRDFQEFIVRLDTR